MAPARTSAIAVCLDLARGISRTRTVEEIYDLALDALAESLGVCRSSILLFDGDGVMRFKASRGLSSVYRRAVEGHTPWRPETPDPAPIVVADVERDESLAPFLATIRAEGIAALAFIPLVSFGRVIGKFMLYYGEPYRLNGDELQVASLVASQVAFAVERTRAEEQARRSEDLAREASRVKDEFLAVLSHELRTPLNAVLGWVQILDAGLTPERVQQAIDVIGRNARLQAQLIEEILDLSRIITGKLELDRRPVPVSQIVEAAVNGILPAARARHLRLRRQISTPLPAVEGDPKRLLQVLGNVLSNAVKFTPEGGRIEVRCAEAGGQIDIQVRDSGIGIAPDLLPHVFDRFRQGDSRSIQRQGGLGLGLAIARHLVQLHRGEIRAESEGAGLGTTISIRLPAASREPAAAMVRAQPVETHDQLRLEGSRIVVVDDQRDSRDLLVMLFETQGADVVSCGGVDEALDAVTSSHVDLVVADIAMPEADGYELIRRVREIDRRIPAVAVSAHARAEDRGRALASGYDGYCAKPIETPSLLRTVRAVLVK
jgi:signal transduction histidine kinase/CheY-like chemotaxis protein